MYSWSNLPKPNVIFVLGGPGAGKGTQCSLICAQLGPSWIHLSAGDLLRGERANPESVHGQLIEERLSAGLMVPAEITCTLLENAILERMISLVTSSQGGEGQGDGGHGDAQGRELSPPPTFLIDGFPRNESNLNVWSKQLAERVNLKFVLFLDCSKEACIEKCLERGKSSGRSDDNARALAARLDVYSNESVPIVEHYREVGLLRSVDATNGTIQQVFQEVMKLMNE